MCLADRLAQSVVDWQCRYEAKSVRIRHKGGRKKKREEERGRKRKREDERVREKTRKEEKGR